ncbi:MAG: CFI-box-CTERM domain-containing protein, partial [bacterium]|nr:CFI-box-CTERM domain-containing protein [bacterium]
FGKTIGGGNFGDFPEYPTVTSTGDFFYKGFGYFWDFVTPGTNPSSFDNAGYTSDIKVWATWGGLSSDSLSSYTITVDMISGNSTIGYSGTDLAGPFVVTGGTFDDGDDDPWVTAGLGVSLRLEIRHSGIPNTARGVTAVLDVDAPGIASVSNSTVYYGDLPALTSSTGDAEFLFTMARPAAAFTWVPLDFHITDTKGNLSSETVFLPVMAPPNTPPAVVIIEGPPPVSRGDAASFSWSGSDQEGIVEGYYIGLDSAGDPSVWTTATSVTYSGLAYGEHAFAVKALDDDGAESGVLTWSFTLRKPSGGRGPCFVATALWGDQHWKTNRLRAFRDGYLERSDVGSRLVRLYYRASPGPAQWVARRPRLRKTLSILLSTLLWPFFL